MWRTKEAKPAITCQEEFPITFLLDLAVSANPELPTHDIYAPKLRLVMHEKDNSEIWKIPKTGVSSELPLNIPAPLGRQAGIAIVLDPFHKEVIIATGAGNSVMTFSVPEVFDDWPARGPFSTAVPPR